MTVAIEEVTAEMEPIPPEPPLGGQDPSQNATTPETESRKLANLQARLECRTARIAAD